MPAPGRRSSPVMAVGAGFQSASCGEHGCPQPNRAMRKHPDSKATWPSGTPASVTITPAAIAARARYAAKSSTLACRTPHCAANAAIKTPCSPVGVLRAVSVALGAALVAATCSSHVAVMRSTARTLAARPCIVGVTVTHSVSSNSRRDMIRYGSSRAMNLLDGGGNGRVHRQSWL
jgi:hypothetical protein